MRFVSHFERRSTLHVPKPPPRLRHDTHLFCHMHSSGCGGEFICACYYRLTDNAVSHERNSQGSPFWALGVIAWGHIARITALKHVNQGGKLLNLCDGVRKMLLKKHGFAFSVMSGVRNLGARIPRTNQRKRVEFARVCCVWKKGPVQKTR